ncbi:hypothetical protein BD410DRAFT_805621 [Rickenella mellea]|uniref:Uncharacterized protein n=1 Tax=Rickenella mellea TaxID=50990 RepID=A0A4Y7PWW6_9AGAM|nr:hypothetical protein BD410DRAFT_805621 [Rickenella mellea]
MCAIVFISFFTFAEELRSKYCDLFGAVAKHFGWSLPDKDAPKSGNDTLPPMFPSHKTNDLTFPSPITTHIMDEMAEREQMSASSRFFDSSSTIVVSDSQMDLRDTQFPNTTNAPSTRPQSTDMGGSPVTSCKGEHVMSSHWLVRCNNLYLLFMARITFGNAEILELSFWVHHHDLLLGKTCDL